MEVDVLDGGARVGGGIAEVGCAAEHGEDDGEGLGGVGEGDVEDGAGVDDGMDGGIVVFSWLGQMEECAIVGVGSEEGDGSCCGLIRASRKGSRGLLA